MGGGSLPRLFRRGGATFEPVHLALKISEAGKPELVSRLLETPSRTHAALSGLHHGFPRLDLEEQDELLDLRPGFEPTVACGPGQPARLSKDLGCL